MLSVWVRLRSVVGILYLHVGVIFGFSVPTHIWNLLGISRPDLRSGGVYLLVLGVHEVSVSSPWRFALEFCYGLVGGRLELL